MRSNEIQRNFSLGDSWIYYKIYTGQKTSDSILKSVIKPISEELINDEIIDKWFFIRYADPKYHIRVRFHYKRREDIGIIINKLSPYFRELIDQDIIWKLQTDIYHREIERYGINTINLTEKLFYYDSIMIVDFIDLLEGDHGEELRWIFALKAIDSFLSCFKYSIEDKQRLLSIMSLNFRNQFDSSKILGAQLNDKYRINRDKVESFLSLKRAKGGNNFKKILKIIDEKEKNIEPIVSEIMEFDKREELCSDINELIMSYIHMTLNRLFKSKSRLNEMVCYDFLNRYYKSIIARGIKSKI